MKKDKDVSNDGDQRDANESFLNHSTPTDRRHSHLAQLSVTF